MRQLSLRAIAVVGIFVPLHSQTPTEATRVAAMEHRLVSNLEFDRVITRDASLIVLKNFKQPGGIVTTLSGDCRLSERRSLTLPAGTDLGSALDIIVPSSSSSSWAMNNSVVNIVPREGLPEILGLKIETFDWSTEDEVGVVIRRLFGNDRVKTFLTEHGFVSGIQTGAGIQAAPRPGVAVKPPGQPHSLKETTLLGAMNGVVASYGGAVWMYQEDRCGDKKEYRITTR